MIAILEKTEHNIDFHQIVDFIEAFHIRDDRQGEAFLTVSSLDAGQDRENIIKTSALPHESSPRVTSLDADEGRQRKCRAYSKGCSNQRGDNGDREEVGADKSIELGRNDTDKMVNVLSSMEAANILTSEVAAVSVSPVAAATTAGVPTVSGLFPTASAIFTTASVVTPYSRRSKRILAKDKGKKKVVESEVPKKRKLQEQIDAQVAREMEEEFTIENQRLSEQLIRDSEIARLHAEEELKMMIEGLDRSNEVIVKHLQEYEQAAVDLSVREKIELINELVKYQDHHAKILKYQAQQSMPLSKKEQKEFYMSVLRSHAGWKTKHFRGMTLEEIKEKFILVWKQLEDFMPMSSKEEGERVKRKGLKLDHESAKRIKTSEDVSEEDLKGMMQLVPLEEVYVEALQVKHPIIDWEIHSKEKREEDLHQLWTLVKETLSIKQATKDKEKELWVELKRLFEQDFKDQLWTHNQAFMHDPLEWKLYDTCGVHYVFTKDQEIFMLVEIDYPLRKGLATVMIIYAMHLMYVKSSVTVTLKVGKLETDTDTDACTSKRGQQERLYFLHFTELLYQFLKAFKRSSAKESCLGVEALDHESTVVGARQALSLISELGCLEKFKADTSAPEEMKAETEVKENGHVSKISEGDTSAQEEMNVETVENGHVPEISEGNTSAPEEVNENGHVPEISEGNTSAPEEMNVKNVVKDAHVPEISKCDTSAPEEMNVRIVVKDDHVPEISVKIGRQLLTVNTSPQQIQHNFLKRLLGSRFVVHMRENELLHDVFKFKPEKRKSGRELYVAERDEVGIDLFVPDVIREENFRRIHNSQNSIF
nr:hypothetical protein [Tanacetum cinerariifolium]